MSQSGLLIYGNSHLAFTVPFGTCESGFDNFCIINIKCVKAIFCVCVCGGGGGALIVFPYFLIWRNVFV